MVIKELSIEVTLLKDVIPSPTTISPTLILAKLVSSVIVKIVLAVSLPCAKAETTSQSVLNA